jgi:hypothetical protein
LKFATISTSQVAKLNVQNYRQNSVHGYIAYCLHTEEIQRINIKHVRKYNGLRKIKQYICSSQGSLENMRPNLPGFAGTAAKFRPYSSQIEAES